mmetsp:Transcript_35125/g.78176  ORF Transcript_35125/g.78176 Transcript_35125/m.78176 type:complete len:210 (+) Transcript_35125:1-630(+)
MPCCHHALWLCCPLASCPRVCPALPAASRTSCRTSWLTPPPPTSRTASSSRASTSAPASNSRSTMPACPDCTAVMRGVSSRTCTSAPPASSTLATSRWVAPREEHSTRTAPSMAFVGAPYFCTSSSVMAAEAPYTAWTSKPWRRSSRDSYPEGCSRIDCPGSLSSMSTSATCPRWHAVDRNDSRSPWMWRSTPTSRRALTTVAKPLSMP